MLPANWLLDWFMYRYIEVKTLAHTIIEFILVLYILVTLILWLAGINPRKRKVEAIFAIVLLVLFEVVF